MTVVIKAKDRTWLRNCVAAICATWCEEAREKKKISLTFV